MKKLSAILMTLVMVFTVSCSNGSDSSSSDKKEKKDSASTEVAAKDDLNNGSEAEVLAKVERLTQNIQQLAENNDEALMNQTVSLYLQLEPIMKNASKDLKDKVEKIMEPVNDEKYVPVLMTIMEKAKNGSSSNGGSDEYGAPVEVEEAEVMEVAEPNF